MQEGEMPATLFLGLEASFGLVFGITLYFFRNGDYMAAAIELFLLRAGRCMHACNRYSLSILYFGGEMSRRYQKPQRKYSMSVCPLGLKWTKTTFVLSKDEDDHRNAKRLVQRAELERSALIMCSHAKTSAIPSYIRQLSFSFRYILTFCPGRTTIPLEWFYERTVFLRMTGSPSKR